MIIGQFHARTYTKAQERKSRERKIFFTFFIKCYLSTADVDAFLPDGPRRNKQQRRMLGEVSLPDKKICQTLMYNEFLLWVMDDTFLKARIYID